MIHQGSEVVIRAVGLQKVYRLYASPRDRLLDLLGLLRSPDHHYTEYAALNGIDLEIRKGEKVCVIGRNGAGKSTFLKLVTNVIRPTSGVLEVQGDSRALLQLGTGFHPDFSGRENIISYLAHLGITGQKAKERVDEIIDFAELEEYIDQPVKTYSTGMNMRLMFSAATVVAPSLLVIDEILSVGDAYFAHKSFERIRSMCEGLETTLLLVSHDIYSAAKLCNRMVWLDRGSIVIDAAPETVINAYEDSIRRQEERRLRLKKMTAMKRGPTGDHVRLLLELRSPQNRPLPNPVYFSRISLAISGTSLDEVPIVDPETNATATVLEGDNAWGPPTRWVGRNARPMLNHGTVFHKVAAAFDVDGLLNLSAFEPFHFEIECWSEQPVRLQATAYLNDVEYDLGGFSIHGGEWQLLKTSPARQAGSVSENSLSSAGLTGSGAVTIDDVQTVDENGNSRFRFSHGEPFKIVIRYSIHDPSVNEVQGLITFHRDGVHDVCRWFAPQLKLSSDGSRSGVIEVSVPRLKLGTGRYTVSLGITEAGYYDKQQVVFYSINPGMYDCRARLFEIEVLGTDIIPTGTGVVGDADWKVEALKRDELKATTQSSM